MPRFEFNPSVSTNSHWEFARFAAKLTALSVLLCVAALAGGVLRYGLLVSAALATWAGDVFDAAGTCDPGEDLAGNVAGHPSNQALWDLGTKCHHMAARLRRTAG